MSARLSPSDVEHVAALARLALTADEIEQFTEQLTVILEHAQDVAALDLEDVPPTAHPVPLVNVLRPDEVTPEPRSRRRCSRRRPRPRTTASGSRGSWARPRDGTRDRRCGAPRRPLRPIGGRGAPGRRSTAREPELHAFNLVMADDALAAADAVDAVVGRGEDPGPLAGVPVALKDNLCTQRCRDHLLVADPRRLAAAVHRDGRGPPARRGRRPDRQDEPRRVRDGLVDGELGVRRDPQPAGHRRACRAGRAAARPRRWRPGSRRSRSAPTPAARSASPPRCAAWSGSSRPTAGCSRYGLIAFASSLDQIGPFADDRGRRRARCSRRSGATTDLDSTSIDSVPEPLGDLTDVAGLRVGIVEELTDVDGIEPEVKAAVERAAAGARRRRARRSSGSRCRAAPTGCRVLPDRAGRGVEQPRPVRRRALRAPGRRRGRRRDERDARATRASVPR